MKKHVLFFCLLFTVGLVSFGQEAEVKEAKKWTYGGMGGITLNEVGLFNWSAGGSSNITLIGRFNVFANYKKEKVAWDNSLDLGYGLLKDNFIFDPKRPITKAEDKIELTSKWSRQLHSEKVRFAVLFNWMTQFAPGYASLADAQAKNRMSKFMAPGYFRLETGIDWKPHESFSLFFAPVAVKLTTVLDDSLAAAGAFGVNMKKDDGTFTFGSSEKTRAELGASLRAVFKRDLTKNIGFETKLGLFTNYVVNPQFIDVDWQTGIVAKFTDYISMNLFTHLIYDYDVVQSLVDRRGDAIMIEDPANPGQEIQKQGRRIQFKQLFGVGFSYKF